MYIYTYWGPENHDPNPQAKLPGRSSVSPQDSAAVTTSPAWSSTPQGFRLLGVLDLGVRAVKFWGYSVIEYGVYGDLIIIYPKPYSIYLRGTIGVRGSGNWGLGITQLRATSSGPQAGRRLEG